MEKAEAEMNRVQKPVEELDETCPECGRNLVIRTGRFGRFISCSGFPECRYGRSVVNKTGALCPNCGGDLVERKTKQKKRIFYGCNNYPTCNFAIWEKPVPEVCPNCNGLMVIPRVGQDPVCYHEVIVPQRNAEEKPHQNGTSTRRSSRKQATAGATSVDGTSAKSPAKTKTTRRATTTRKKTSTMSRKTSSAIAKKKTPARASARKATTKRASTS